MNPDETIHFEIIGEAVSAIEDAADGYEEMAESNLDHPYMARAQGLREAVEVLESKGVY